MLKLKADLSEDSQRSLIKGASRTLEPFGIGASMLSDQLAYYRLKCLVQIVEKSKVLLQSHGYDPEPVSKKFLARFIEEASYEDDPNLQEMWANLLASESIEGQKYGYINILRELDSEAAELLQNIYKKFEDKDDVVLKATLQQHQRAFGLGEAEFDVNIYKNSEFVYLVCFGLESDKQSKKTNAITNSKLLDKLGLIQLNSYQGNLKSPNGKGYALYAVLNLIGKDFVETCSGQKIKE